MKCIFGGKLSRESVTHQLTQTKAGSH